MVTPSLLSFVTFLFFFFFSSFYLGVSLLIRNYDPHRQSVIGIPLDTSLVVPIRQQKQNKIIVSDKSIERKIFCVKNISLFYPNRIDTLINFTFTCTNFLEILLFHDEISARKDREKIVILLNYVSRAKRISNIAKNNSSSCSQLR